MSDVKPIKRILYATNLGNHMRPVFAYAINMAKVHNAKIVMFHAVPPLGSSGQALLSVYLSEDKIEEIENSNMADVIATMETRLKNYCAEEEDICKDQEKLIEDIVVIGGKPAKAIEEYAATNEVDLVVVGSHSRESITGLLGSTARHVTQHCKTPVLVIPNS